MNQNNRPFSKESGQAENAIPVVIVGGGPVGMSLALALHRHGIATEIFDARERGAGLNDRRILALSHGTRQTLEWLGVWQGIDATPIKTIHVSQRGRAGRTIIRADEQQVPALGHVVSMHELYKMLDQAIRQVDIAYHHNTRVAQVKAEVTGADFLAGTENRRALLVAYAEGVVDANTSTTKIGGHDYGQHAVTAIVTAQGNEANTAWERFTDEGPVALLPFGNTFALVQTCTPESAAGLISMPDAEFLSQLQTRFGQRLQFIATGPRFSFPLGLRYRQHAIAERQVWLGNAAQTLHPVAGQGFNLALRDVRELARTLANVADPGSGQALDNYASKRRIDRRSTIGFTDVLVRLFSNNNPLLGHARGAGLLGLDLFPALRSFVARRMMFGARGWP